MKLDQIFEDTIELDEAAMRQFKRFGSEIRRYFRCTSGPKKGQYVSKPNACAQRKDPRKDRHGKKVARSKKGVIARKSQISKRSAVSKLLKRVNKRLSTHKKNDTKK